MSDLMPTRLDRLRDQSCDRVAFTPEHAECVYRLTNAAADEIERLRRTILSALDCLHHDDAKTARRVLAGER